MFLTLIAPLPEGPDRLDGAWLDRLLRGVRLVRSCLPYTVEVLVVGELPDEGVEHRLRSAQVQFVRASGPGRGNAIREGMLAASGAWRMCFDPAWSMPPEQVLLLIPPALSGMDVAVGSRFMSGATRKKEPFVQDAIGRFSTAVCQVVASTGIQDPLSVIKAYRGEAAVMVFSRSLEEGWAAEVEGLALARELSLTIAEVPIDWVGTTPVGPRSVGQVASLFSNLLRVRRRLVSGHYPPPAPPLAGFGSDEWLVV